MQARQPETRTVPPIKSEEQWESLVETIATTGDAIVENESGTKVAVISYDEFLEYQEQRQQKLRDEALRRLSALEERIGNRNDDLSDEYVEELANRATREIRDELNRKYRAGLLDFPNIEQE